MSVKDEVEVVSPLVVDAITVKLPKFWSTEPLLWFGQAESQFALRSITVDETKFHHVVAALDQETAKRVADIFISPPPIGTKFKVLKERLLSTFSLSSYQRAQRLLQVAPLGDRSPSELMSDMLALVAGHEPCFLFKSIFMNHLPKEVRTHLIPILDSTTPRDLALKADELILVERQALFAISTPTKGWSGSSVHGRKSWCRFHQRYGPKAYSCEQPCSFIQRGTSFGGGKHKIQTLQGNEEIDHQ